MLSGLVDYEEQAAMAELVDAAARSRDEWTSPYRLALDRVQSVKLHFRERFGEPVDFSEWLLWRGDESTRGVLAVRAIGIGALDVVRQDGDAAPPYRFVTSASNGVERLLSSLPLPAVQLTEVAKLLTTRYSLLSARVRGYEIRKQRLPCPDDVEELTETASECWSHGSSPARSGAAVATGAEPDGVGLKPESGKRVEEELVDSSPVSLCTALCRCGLVRRSTIWEEQLRGWRLRNSELGRRLVQLMLQGNTTNAWLVIEMKRDVHGGEMGGMLDSVSALYLTSSGCRSPRLVIELRHAVVSSEPRLVLFPVSSAHVDPSGTQLHSDEGYYDSAVGRYTYAGERSVRGLVLTGEQNDEELVTYAHALYAYTSEQDVAETYEALERGGEEASMPASIPDFTLPSAPSSTGSAALSPLSTARSASVLSPSVSDAPSRRSDDSAAVPLSRRTLPCGCIVTMPADAAHSARVRQVERCVDCSARGLQQHRALRVLSADQRSRDHLAAVFAVPLDHSSRVPIRVAIRKYCATVPDATTIQARHYMLGSKLISSLLDLGRSSTGRYYVDSGRVQAVDFSLLFE